MLIAKDKKKNNIAEYVLYMWQLEDLIRAFQFDILRIKNEVINQFNQPENIKSEIFDWYNNFIKMMIEERIQKVGHLQIIKNVSIELFDLHLRLMGNPDEIKYRELNTWAKPNIEELRKKHSDKSLNDIEIALEGLYGLLMLRLQKKEVTTVTRQAMATISNLLAYLAAKYKISHSEESL